MIKYFLENRISAFMLCASLVTAGMVSLSMLPVALLPGTECPALSVLIEYPGVAPDKIESLLTKPVERIIKTVSGIEQVESVSEEGKSKINITFSDDTDIKIAAVKIRGKIGLIKDTFPREVQEPVVMRYDPTERPVVVAAAEIDGADRDSVREIMEKRVKPALQRIDGISEIIIAGGEQREIHIETDVSMAAGRGILAEDISGAVSSNNVRLPGGTVEGTWGNMRVYIPSGFKSLGEISDSLIFTHEGRCVRVRDVADVKYGTRERENLSRYNGADMVTIYVHKGGGANTLELCRSVKQVFDSFTDVRWRMIYNQGEHIESSVNNALFSGVWGIAIVVLMLSLFFRRREAVIPVVLAIPASILIVPSFMYMTGRGINIMTISGFALGAGMVVDNGIVIMDAIKRRGGGKDGVIDAVNEMKLPVISSTFTAISVFIPVMLISEKTGTEYGDMAFVITASLLVSLFFSVVMVPSIFESIRNLRRMRDKAYEPHNAMYNYNGGNKPVPRHLYFVTVVRRSACERLLCFRERIAALETAALVFYRRTLAFSIEHSGRVCACAGGAFFAALFLVSFINNDRISAQGENEFYLYLEFPTGTSLDRTDSFVADVEKMVCTAAGVESVSSRTEKWRGTLTVRTAESLSFKGRWRLRDELKTRSNAIIGRAGGFAYISEADELASREVTVHFLGDDSGTLKMVAREGASRINAVEGVSECMLRFREGRPEYTIAVDRDAAGRTGVSHASVAESVRNALFGPVITKYIDRDHEVDVRVRLAERDRESIDALLNGRVRSESGALVPLRGVTSMAENEGLTKIFRLNGRKSCSITARIGALSFQEAEKRMGSVLRSMDMPEGYTWEFDRSLAGFREERRSLIFAAAVSLLLIYMILASLFESFTLPFLVMTTLPLALTGVAPVLFIAGIPLSPAVFMGLIMLAGIVMNNGILLVESVRRVMGNYPDCGSMDALIRGVAEIRFRPVMITAVTAILGMMPMALHTGEGSSLWRPFAITVTSGLFFSTLLTLVVLPLLCGRYFYYRLRMV